MAWLRDREVIGNRKGTGEVIQMLELTGRAALPRFVQGRRSGRDVLDFQLMPT